MFVFSSPLQNRKGCFFDRQTLCRKDKQGRLRATSLSRAEMKMSREKKEENQQKTKKESGKTKKQRSEDMGRDRQATKC